MGLKCDKKMAQVSKSVFFGWFCLRNFAQRVLIIWGGVPMLFYAKKTNRNADYISLRVAYQNLRLIRLFPQCHLPKLKHISAEALPWHFTSLRLPWVSQWESVVALESDDPRCCIFPRSAKNNLASRSCPPPSWLCYLLVSSALCSP